MVIDRLAQYIEYKHISFYAFENSLNASRGSISKAVKENKNIGSNVLENILITYPDLNADWLLMGKGEMLRPDIADHENQVPLLLREPITKYLLRSDRKLENQQVPLYNTQAAAGLTKTFSDPPDVLQHISIPNLPKCDGAIYITGDSMYPLLKSGDIIAYKKISDIKNSIIWGQMYLLSFLNDGEDYTMVKYIQKSELGPEYVNLVSQNQHHQAKDIVLKDITALALIKASIRFNSMN